MVVNDNWEVLSVVSSLSFSGISLETFFKLLLVFWFSSSSLLFSPRIFSSMTLLLLWASVSFLFVDSFDEFLIFDELLIKLSLSYSFSLLSLSLLIFIGSFGSFSWLTCSGRGELCKILEVLHNSEN